MSTPRQISKVLNMMNLETNKVVGSVYDSDTIAVTSNKGATTPTGTLSVTSADTLPTNPLIGTQAVVSSTGRFYVFNGSGWYNVATINSTPYWIDEANATYELNTDGTATVIEINAGDSDNTTPVYTATGDSNFNAIATVVQDSEGRFIVRSFDSDGSVSKTDGSGILTFIASDGIDQASTASTFTISFTLNWSTQPNNVPLPFPTGLTAGGSFGWSGALSGDGNYAIACAAGSHQAAVYVRTGSNSWAEQSVISSINQSYFSASSYGWCSDISSDGSTAVVGGRNYTGASGTKNGAVWVYVRNGTTWSLQTTITGASSPVNHGWTYQGNDAREIGYSLALSDDGNTFVTGSRYDAGVQAGGNNIGEVYLLQRTGTSWSGTTLRAPDQQANDLFGTAVAISGDSNYILVGAPGESGGSGDPYPGEGCIYVFVRSGSSFNYQATLRPNFTGDTRGIRYLGGNGLAINQDGTQVIAASDYDGGNIRTWYRSGTSWFNGTKIDRTLLSSVFGGTQHGRSVAMDAAGDNAYVSTITTVNGVAETGSWIHLTRSGNTWSYGNYGPWTVTTSGYGAYNSNNTGGARLSYGQALGQNQQLTTTDDGKYVLFSGIVGNFLGSNYTGEAHVFKSN